MNKVIKIILFGFVAFCGYAAAQEQRVALKDWTETKESKKNSFSYTKIW